MKKYRVCGTTTVIVYKEVWANDEEDAYEKARNRLDSLTEYCGNGGYDKLIGVDGDDESVAVYEDIYYDEIEMLEDNPDYMECEMCGGECEKRVDSDGTEYFECQECYRTYDEDGYEYFPEEDNE